MRHPIFRVETAAGAVGVTHVDGTRGTLQQGDAVFESVDTAYERPEAPDIRVVGFSRPLEDLVSKLFEGLFEGHS